MKIAIPPHKKIFLYGGGLVAACVALWVFVIGPYTSEIVTLSDELYDARVQLASAKKQQDNLVILSQDLKSVESRIGALDATIIPSERSLDFISALEGMASETGVTQLLSLSPLESSSEVQEVPLVIEGTGDLQQLLNFLRRLETSPYYISPRIIDLTPESGAIVHMTLQTKTYWIEKAL